MLRAGGPSFDVEAFCATTSLPIDTKHRVGDQRLPVGRISSESGIGVQVSGAAFDNFAQQVADATVFLERHAEEVRRLVTFAGVDGATLDFGIKRRDVAAQHDSFPARLVSLAGALGVSLGMTQYEIAVE